MKRLFTLLCCITLLGVTTIEANSSNTNNISIELTTEQEQSLDKSHQAIMEIKTEASVLKGMFDFENLIDNLTLIGNETNKFNEEKLNQFPKTFAKFSKQQQESLQEAFEETIQSLEDSLKRTTEIVEEVEDMIERGMSNDGILKDEYAFHIAHLCDEMLVKYANAFSNDEESYEFIKEIVGQKVKKTK